MINKRRKKLYKKGGTKFIDKSIAAMIKNYQGKELSGKDFDRDIASFEKAYGKDATSKLRNQLSPTAVTSASDDAIPDSTFIDGIEFLIKNEIILIPNLPFS